MKPRRPELADVLTSFAAAYRSSHPVSADQGRVLRDLTLCRTAALGGHKLECDRCGHQEISYNSCRNRHCPKCLGTARAKWLADRESELLNVPYFHIVFTMPEELAQIALQDKRGCYGLLFRASAETLRTIALDPKHLGASIGFLSVLHTWSQNLLHHPHVHCVVPGGGISPEGDQWIPSRKRFFLPVRVLSRLFRRLYLDGLQRLFSAGELGLHGRLEHLRDPGAWASFMSGLRKKDWVVYSKPPFGGPVQALKYLARYTHRVAISNSRILEMTGDRVRFLWKDRAADGRSKCMTVRGVEFVRRFLLHVLPKGFVRIRHYGFLANRARKKSLALVHDFLGRPVLPGSSSSPDTDPQLQVEPPVPIEQCPKCEDGNMRIIEEIPAADDTS